MPQNVKSVFNETRKETIPGMNRSSGTSLSKAGIPTIMGQSNAGPSGSRSKNPGSKRRRNKGK